MKNEDVFKYINSRDIREHLEKLDFQFTPLQASWLVWQCEQLSMKDRIAAWRDMAATMPDQPLEPKQLRNLDADFNNLHEYLNAWTVYQEEMVEDFIRPQEKYIYILASSHPNYSITEEGYFETFEQCIDGARERFGNLDEPYAFSDRFLNRDCFPLTITKQKLGSEDYDSYAGINTDFKISSIAKGGEYWKEPGYLDDIFEMCWFDFPIPFVKGDVVKNCAEHDDTFGPWHGPFVFIEYQPETERRMLREHPERKRKPFEDYMGSMDMCAEGYFQDSEKGELFGEVMHEYMNLEYYRGDYPGVRRILKALSSLEKGKINEEMFGYAYTRILLEGFLDSIKPNAFLDEAFEYAGLSSKKSNAN